MLVDKKTPLSAIKLAYEMGIEHRTGRMEERAAGNVLQVLASADGGQVTVDGLGLEKEVYQRMYEESVGIDNQQAQTCAEMAHGAAVLSLFLLKGLQDGSIARVADGIREGSNEEFVDAFLGERP